MGLPLGELSIISGSLFSPNQLSYYYDGIVHVVPEFDGVRLVTHDTCEFLHKVTGMFAYKICFPIN